MNDNSDLIRSTNDDALQSKMSAITAGYLVQDKEGFTKLIAGRGASRMTKRQPIINRGSYARTLGIDRVVKEFIDWNKIGCHGRPCQIISLGAGSDARYFELKAAGFQPHLYVEIDFGQITGKKAMTICKNSKLKEMLQGDVKIESGGLDLISNDYWLLSGDLYNFTSSIMERLLSLGLDTSLPTLFLSECVLIYMSSAAVMIQNLKLRGLSLESIHANPTLESQMSRYLKCGWKKSAAIDLLTFWKDWVPASEKERVSKLEIFDEEEEWNLLTAHYCFVFASTVDQVPCFLFT